MKLRHFIVFMILFGSLSGCGDSSLSDGLILYDDFSSGAIDPTKWVSGGTLGSSISVVSEALVSEAVANVSPVGSYVAFSDNDVTAISAILQVNALSVTQGDINAGIYGTFYNDGSGISGSAAGDVTASLELGRGGSPGDISMDIFYTVSRCSSPSCLSKEVLATGSMGTAHQGYPVKLYMSWDGTNIFNFQVGNDDPVGFIASTATNGGLPSFSAEKRLGTDARNSPVGSIQASFDYVMCLGTPCVVPAVP